MPSQLPDIPPLMLLETDEEVGGAIVAGRFDCVIRASSELRSRHIMVVHPFLDGCYERWWRIGRFT